MEYLHTMIRVKDLDESLTFFVEFMGLTEVNRIDSEDGRFTLIYLAAENDLTQAKEKNSPTIELTYNWPTKGEAPEEYNNGRNFGHLAFGVKDIYETCQKLLNHGVVINRPPRDGYMAFLKSPDNISIELLQLGKALEPKEPWKSMENIGSW